MRVLALYTAGEPASIAVIAGSTEATLELPRGRHLERIAVAAKDLLVEAGLRPSDLDAVAVALGPGSFTGLRVGASIALGLARGVGLALYAVPTLEIWAALALRTFDPVDSCHVALDARRGELHFATFRSPGARPAKVRPHGQGDEATHGEGAAMVRPELFDGPHLITPAGALARVREAAPVVGDGREALVAEGMDPERPGFSEPSAPLALALARLAAPESGRTARPLHGFALVYGREPQAAVIRAERGRGSVARET